MADDDDIDIYEDLANFGEQPTDEYSENFLDLKQKCIDLENRVTNLEKELEKVLTVKNTLEVNLSSLVKTAKTEIARKDRMIGELRSELENTLFRRNNYRIPKINHCKTDTTNVSTVNTNQRRNSSINTVEATKTRVNNTESIYATPIVAVESKDNDGDCEDGGEIYQPNKFTSTVYGKRLKKKLIEQEQLEKLQKEELKLAALTSVKTVSKDEPETSSNNIHRDNNENQCHQTIPSEDNSKTSPEKSLKRPNDEALHGHCDKRIKLIHHKNEIMDRRDNENSGNINSSESNEIVDRNCNYRLERIEIQSRISTRRQNEEAAAIQRNIDEQRDNYRGKYRKHRSNSRSRSRESSNYTDKRKDSSNRNKEYNRRHDNEILEHHRSGCNRDIQNKHEMRRDVRNRDARYCNRGRGKIINLRNHIDHHRRQKNVRTTGRRYNKEPYENRKRFGDFQHRRNDEYWNDGMRNIDNKKYEDRCKFSDEFFSDKSNDSEKIEKSKVVNKNVETTSMISLEEGEIVGSPISTPQKNRANSVVVQNPTIKILDRNLLNTLSVETHDIESTGDNYPKSIFTSPQEEKIENIEAFIRNFTCNEVLKNLSPTATDDVSNMKTQSSCNTTKNIAETLGCEKNGVTTNECPEKSNDALNNPVEKRLNYDGEMLQEPLMSHELSSNIPGVDEKVNTLLSEPTVVKVETISINNISTSYADVLLKYVRKKKKSTSDSESSIPDKDSILIPVKIDTNNTYEASTKINNESSVCTKIEQPNAKNNCADNNTGNNSSVVMNEPPEEISCKKSVALPKDNAINKCEINTVEIVNANIEIAECATQLPDNKPQINSAIQKSDRDKNETNVSAEEDEKSSAINEVPISQRSNCDSEAFNQVIFTPINNQDGVLVTVQQTVDIQDKLIDEIEKKNEPTKLETIKCLKITSEHHCKSECELNSSKNTTDKINECEKSSNSIESRKKIVVARRKKRPVQLTNSSSSLTVVLSAYSINNNRICKSKMKAPVTLSDT